MNCTSIQAPQQKAALWWLLGCLALPLLTTSTGCAGRLVYARDLPSQYVAPPVANAQTVDLSRLASVAVSSELIEPGDVVEVTLGSGAADRNTITVPVRVVEDGTVNVPLVGQVAIAGLELEGAEQAIRVAAVTRGIFRNPLVTVLIDRKGSNRVTVLGAVNQPGPKELPRSQSDLLNLLVAAGGLSDEAGTVVEIRRPARRVDSGFQRRSLPPREATAVGAQPASHIEPVGGYVPAQSFRIDLVAATHTGQGATLVDDGDVVMVMKRDPQPIHVMGLVMRPNQYEMPVNRELRVLDCLAMAGGVKSPVADKIFVIRRIPGEAEPLVIQVSLSAAKRNGRENIRLAPGDTVSVEQTPVTVLLDAIKSFIRIGVNGSARIF
ncbi:MAG: hypothetical protein DWQ31_21355 [Planctomycetota bacterium]|nr:MAG: hypothetical protein DWQ31_21355 [Planctomycetota bacterium]REJ93653.1 MAG: hypothetical protein DWQ35_09890 [Planctomycetota bacterium]REK25702.1 MAG: hypothetical protein DWQ42_10630 [Planctomycetota bacterium]REK46552.1 MAG: hypothetical protein DWQ46_06675 [Planctomycetota bacterium]